MVVSMRSVGGGEPLRLAVGCDALDYTPSPFFRVAEAMEDVSHIVRVM